MRALPLVALAGLVGLSLQGAVSAGASAPKPWSLAWLAQNHTKYDNAITARYEQLIHYGKGDAKPLTPDQVASFAAGTDRRMSTPSFADNQNEFQIDINPVDHTHAIGASNDGRTSGTGYYTTSDSGRTWFAADLPLGQSSCCDPGIAYAFDGTAYFENLDTSPAVFHVMKSIDNGATWHSVTDISPGDDRSNIVVDNGTTSPHKGRIFVTYTDFGTTNEIRLFYSDNQGASWTGPVNVSHTGSSGAAYPQSSQPRVANDGTVYVGFQYYPDGTHNSAQDRIARSTDGGVTFATSVIISAGPHLQGGLDLGDARGYYAVNSSCTTFRHRSFPIMGVDPTNSANVYAIWAGGDLEIPYTCSSFSGYHSDVLFSRSTDSGAHWTAPLKVNDDPAGHDQYYPWMDVSPNGTIWVGWHDRRDDPSNFKHIYYMDRSTNGGVSFGTDHKVGDVASLPTSFIGDYAGLAAENDLVLPMWWDSRSSVNGDPYTQPVRVHILP